MCTASSMPLYDLTTNPTAESPIPLLVHQCFATATYRRYSARPQFMPHMSDHNSHGHCSVCLRVASACRNIEFDAAETVSMFQEKWAWDKSTFLSFARHYKTGEQLSEDTYNNVMQMRRFGQGRGVTLTVMFDQTLTDVFVAS